MNWVWLMVVARYPFGMNEIGIRERVVGEGEWDFFISICMYEKGKLLPLAQRQPLFTKGCSHEVG